MTNIGYKMMSIIRNIMVKSNNEYTIFNFKKLLPINHSEFFANLI